MLNQNFLVAHTTPVIPERVFCPYQASESFLKITVYVEGELPTIFCANLDQN